MMGLLLLLVASIMSLASWSMIRGTWLAWRSAPVWAKAVLRGVLMFRALFGMAGMLASWLIAFYAGGYIAFWWQS